MVVSKNHLSFYGVLEMRNADKILRKIPKRLVTKAAAAAAAVSRHPVLLGAEAETEMFRDGCTKFNRLRVFCFQATFYHCELLSSISSHSTRFDFLVFIQVYRV